MSHPIFSSATVEELQQHLQRLRDAYEPTENNDAFCVLRKLEALSRVGKGLRLDTKHGLGSYSFTGFSNQSYDTLRVKFDGDYSSTGVEPKVVNRFWFEME
jgi:hypothetical protein